MRGRVVGEIGRVGSGEKHLGIGKVDFALVPEELLRWTRSDRASHEPFGPSVAVHALSNQPEYEVREVALQIEGEDRPVRIWYWHIDATDAVDVIAITNG